MPTESFCTGARVERCLVAYRYYSGFLCSGSLGTNLAKTLAAGLA